MARYNHHKVYFVLALCSLLSSLLLDLVVPAAAAPRSSPLAFDVCENVTLTATSPTFRVPATLFYLSIQVTLLSRSSGLTASVADYRGNLNNPNPTVTVLSVGQVYDANETYGAAVRLDIEPNVAADTATFRVCHTNLVPGTNTPTVTNVPPTPTSFFASTSTPSPLPTATRTPSPVPTNTPLPTATRTSTALPTVTRTPTALPTNTPLPTATRTTAPTSTSLPTSTIKPTQTAAPQPTAAPNYSCNTVQVNASANLPMPEVIVPSSGLFLRDGDYIQPVYSTDQFLFLSVAHQHNGSAVSVGINQKFYANAVTGGVNAYTQMYITLAGADSRVNGRYMTVQVCNDTNPPTPLPTATPTYNPAPYNTSVAQTAVSGATATAVAFGTAWANAAATSNAQQTATAARDVTATAQWLGTQVSGGNATGTSIVATVSAQQTALVGTNATAAASSAQTSTAWASNLTATVDARSTARADTIAQNGATATAWADQAATSWAQVLATATSQAAYAQASAVAALTPTSYTSAWATGQAYATELAQTAIVENPGAFYAGQTVVAATGVARTAIAQNTPVPGAPYAPGCRSYYPYFDVTDNYYHVTYINNGDQDGYIQFPAELEYQSFDIASGAWYSTSLDYYYIIQGVSSYRYRAPVSFPVLICINTGAVSTSIAALTPGGESTATPFTLLLPLVMRGRL